MKCWFSSLLQLSAVVAWCQQPVLTVDPFSCFELSGRPAADMTVVPVEGREFTKAWRLKSTVSTNPWDQQIRCSFTAAASKGDTIVARFWVRTISADSGIGTATLVLEKNSSPYTKSVQYRAGASSEWKRIEVPFAMAESYAESGYAVGLWLAYGQQEIEVADLTVLNYGPSVPFSSLGLADWPYEGKGPDAQWRKAAAERIDQYRKADLSVIVRDSDGNPVPDAAVHVAMKRHAFPFGSAVDGGELRSNARYRDTIKRLFNAAVTENDLKWPYWETWSRDNANYSLNWLQENGLRVRGHNIIWPGKSNLPPDVVALLDKGDKEALRKRIASHIAEVMAWTHGRVVDWDVLNEPVTNRDVMTLLGDDEMALWFRQAREADSGVRLYANDFNITENGGYDLARQNAFFNIVKGIADSGAPLDGVGLQSHFGATLTAPARVYEILDRFSSFGADLAVTEYDVNSTDEQLQADYLRDYLTICFSHPKVKAFYIWGFWEGRHWRPNAAMIRRDWTTKLAYDVWMRLVFTDWWTDVSGKTNDDGVFRTRGFLGPYEVEVTLGDEKTAVPVVLGDTSPVVLVVAKK